MWKFNVEKSNGAIITMTANSRAEFDALWDWTSKLLDVGFAESVQCCDMREYSGT